MDLTFVLSVALFTASMCFTPGPNNTMALATGMSKGFSAALPLCLGVGAGANCSLILVYYGLGEVFARFPALYTALNITGAAYMLWLAWKISGLENAAWFRKNAAQKTDDIFVRAGAKTDANFKPLTFLQAFSFQVVNVKVWVANIIATSSYIGTGDGRGLRFCVVFGLFVVLGMSSICLWAAGGAAMRRFLSSDGMRRCNYVFAASLVLSILLLFTTAK